MLVKLLYAAIYLLALSFFAGLLRAGYLAEHGLEPEGQQANQVPHEM